MSAPQAVDLAGAETLSSFVARQPILQMEERDRLVQQAQLLVEQFYVHLPRKRMLRGIDPVRRLALLRERLATIGCDATFHAALSESLAELHDLHTDYLLPGEYADAVAVLPFKLGCCGTDTGRQYLIASVQPGAHGLAPGAEVLSWNGVPIARAVERLAWHSAAASPAAQHARAVVAMTLRPLAKAPPPDEPWVVLGTRDADGTEHTRRFEWRVLRLDQGAPGGAPGVAGDPNDPDHRHLRGLDLDSDQRRRARAALRAPAAPGPAAIHTALPELFVAGVLPGEPEPVGRLRIRSFKIDDAAAFVAEFARLLALMPPGGLVLDVRDNGGGLVEAAEKALRLLVPGPFAPVRFQFLAGPAARALCLAEPELAPWAASVERALQQDGQNDELYSDALPLTRWDEQDAPGRGYAGPVVLLIDPLCYSACDIFAAGFADHGVGRILGTGATGGGGANVWPHSKLLALFDQPQSPFAALPAGAGLRVALRRALRSGRSAGVEIEERGVAPDVLHVPTRRDACEDGADLMARAVAELADMRATAGAATRAG